MATVCRGFIVSCVQGLNECNRTTVYIKYYYARMKEGVVKPIELYSVKLMIIVSSYKFLCIFTHLHGDSSRARYHVQIFRSAPG